MFCVQPCVKSALEKPRESFVCTTLDSGLWFVRRDDSGFVSDQFPYIYFPVTEFKRVCPGMESWQSRSKLNPLFGSLNTA